MRKILPIIFIAIFCQSSLLFSQQDTVSIEPKKLGIQDIIKPVDEDAGKVKIISGSRFPIAASELPYSTYVISKEEIRQNGYETLVDALKMAPGIFTSQPGSAMDGETFLMRGLYGNSYTKILINDIPIKPGLLASMPIGAQLPIREAERIEILYGAGAALYGADASAGVINIITRQSERPVYMQADLAVGSGAYSSANVMFGGKWGRDKNILHYFAYGSNVIYENRYIKRDFTTNFNPDNYKELTLGSTSYQQLDNYVAEPWGDPVIHNTPHLSRKFGLQFKFKRLSISLETMSRRDHSATGLNPVAVSYANPLNYIGESIQRFNINWFNEKTNKNARTDFTMIRYRMDENSSTSFVQPRFAIELMDVSQVLANKFNPNNPDLYYPIIQDSLYKKYLGGNRFMYGASDDFRAEHIRNYRILGKSTLTFGGNFKLTNGTPPTSFLSQPPDDHCSLFFYDPCPDLIDDPRIFPIRPKQFYNYEGNVFGQWFYEGEKVNLVAGFNYSSFTDNEFESVGAEMLPRFAVLWKAAEWINFRSSWGRSYRRPSATYISNSYLFSSEELPLVKSRTAGGALRPERTKSWETGFRILSGKNVNMDFTYFQNNTSNLIAYGEIDVIDEPLKHTSFLSYSNARDSEFDFKGGQIIIFFDLGDKIDVSYKYSWISSELSFSGSFIPTQDYINFLPEYNGKVHQGRLTYRPLPTTTLILDWRRVKSDRPDDSGSGSRTDKFATLDLVGRYAFNDRFDTYFKIVNLTNKEYGGLDATRTSADLSINPQLGIYFKVGMNYYIE